MVSETCYWPSLNKSSPVWFELALDENDDEKYKNDKGQDTYDKQIGKT